ncbi:DUF928 domain-containing protein [Spirulina major]|uniref:DUF928 domain-containing protein n=1 Tax=Spirulina major TaxID=270636 RepID=UPI000A06B371|nr:DUF928 domain-containing protein [Spirulina major]
MSCSPLFTSWKPSLAALCCTALSTGAVWMVNPVAAQMFNPPDRGAPRSASDGGTRGSFVPPDRGAPSSASDGGTRSSFSPPDRGAPSSAGDGGTRTGLTLPSYLKTLVPAGVMPLTLSARPEFYAYVPVSAAQTVKFTLYRHNLDTGMDELLVYEMEQAAPDTSGIMTFNLPEGDRYALEPGAVYHWYVSLVLNPDDPTANIAIDGWVQRLSEDDAIAQRVKQLDPATNPAAYADAGLWYEPLQAYARDRRTSTPAYLSTHCNNATDNWSILLNSAQLCEFSAATFIQ